MAENQNAHEHSVYDLGGRGELVPLCQGRWAAGTVGQDEERSGGSGGG